MRVLFGFSSFVDQELLKENDFKMQGRSVLKPLLPVARLDRRQPR
jgi:hypothetical protein